MSTTIKRVALVAVAALSLGVISVAPSQAAINADSLTLSAVTAAQTTAETATATSAVATLSFLGATGDSASVTAALVSAPAGAVALPYLSLSETSSAKTNGNFQAIGTITNPNAAVVVNAIAGTAVTTAKFKVFLGTDSMTAPSVAGTYVVKLTPAAVGASGSLLAATAQTLTITVTAAPTLDTVVSAATSTSVITSTSDTTTTTDATVTYIKTASLSDEAAYIKVALKNAAGSAVVDSYTAIVTSGPGLLGSGPLTNSYTGDARGRAITVKSGDVVTVYGDGSSGVSTIQISSLAGVILATEKVTFYGDVASIVATVVKPVIGVRNDAGSVTAKAYDAAGVLVSSGTLYIASTDSTILTPTSASASIDATKGYATFDLTGVKAGTTTVTVGNKSTASTVSATAVTVRVGGTSAELANVKVTTDKTSYAPGEAAVITVTPVDAAGLALADDTYTVFATGGITASYTLGSGSATISGTQVVGTSAGVKSYTVYMPVTEGDVKFSWTTGTLAASTANSAVAGSLTVSVSSPSTSAAIDAANEAAQAASDATDAALAAADAADAATAAAQDAVDAVDALSKQVNKLIAALKAQITTLTNLVIKKLGK